MSHRLLFTSCNYAVHNALNKIHAFFFRFCATVTFILKGSPIYLPGVCSRFNHTSLSKHHCWMKRDSLLLVLQI